MFFFMVATSINGSDCFNDSIFLFSLIIIAIINLMIATKISFFENIFQKFIQNIIILMIAIIEDNDIFMIFWKIFCNDFFNDIFVFF